ncbi:MAG: SUMF1/EgtB/PvdO family nonheme iron enzyme [Elusimicrobia bacterium]|nr:SUMF1/EgtB/PvdO family nonheme iron enzyme [Elusimicrobiota bacterium]
MTARGCALAAAALAVLSLPGGAAGRKAPPPRMTLIPAGQFWMGSPEGVGPADEHPRHQVFLRAYYLDRHHVTAEEYAACVSRGACPAPRAGGLCNHGVAARAKDPANCVTWEAARDYCAAQGKRLPTEAEWEKAARGGASTKWSYGENAAALGDYAWFSGNAGGSTRPVGLKRPNQYGLYDMGGNAWQWVWDGYDAHYYQKSPDQDPAGPAAAANRVLRGGSRANAALSSRAAIRYWAEAGAASDTIGFRCAVPADDGTVAFSGAGRAAGRSRP